MKVKRNLMCHLCCSVSLLWSTASMGQNSLMTWSAFDMGYRASASPIIRVKAVVGQSLAGTTSSASTLIESGFLADTLLRGPATEAKVPNGLPTRFKLFQNYPNPFNPATTITYMLPTRNWVSLKVYDILGREVVTLVNEMKQAGTSTVQWTPSNVASGVYVYRLDAGSFVSVKKLLLLK